METTIVIDKTNGLLLITFFSSLFYYNVIECYIIIDRFFNFPIINYRSVNMGFSFLVYPLLVYMLLYLSYIRTAFFRYMGMTLLYFMYLLPIITENINVFPIKTIVILIISVTNVIFVGLLGKYFANKERKSIDNKYLNRNLFLR